MATQKYENFGDLPPEERKKIWLELSDITADEFDARIRHANERQALVPEEGSQAPDFEIDILDRERRRGGETVRLSNLRGKPVGLIFGSYT